MVESCNKFITHKSHVTSLLQATAPQEALARGYKCKQWLDEVSKAVSNTIYEAHNKAYSVIISS